MVINMGPAHAKTVTVDQCPGAASADNDCFFVPDEITIDIGDTVMWTNSDSGTHTVTSGGIDDPPSVIGREFDSGMAKPGSIFEHTFNTKGEYPYFCQLHPWMKGNVIVNGVIVNGPPQTIVMPTDNGSINVEVKIAQGTVDDNKFTIDPPQQVRIDVRFLNPSTDQPLQHVNYALMITDETGNDVVNKAGMHTPEGVDAQSVTFENTGSFTVAIDIAGLGINKPYDTKHSGMASTTLAVVPEFPIAVMTVMGAIIATTIAVSRFNRYSL